MTVFWDVAPCSLVEIDRLELLVSFYENAWRNIPEDSHLHIHNRENLKYHIICVSDRSNERNLKTTK
jgi:hypothetical protein